MNSEKKCYIVYSINHDGRKRVREFQTKAHSQEQAVGFFVSKVIKKPWEKESFFSTLATARDCKNCPKRDNCNLRHDDLEKEEKEDQDHPDSSESKPKVPPPSSPPPKKDCGGIQLNLELDFE